MSPANIDGDAVREIAHDLNNLLTVMLGSAEMLAENLEADDANHELAGNILVATERCADLTAKLLTLARP